jgi:hypothetical protein
MSKLKIDKGASRIRRVPLKTTIDGTVWDDIELMCQWSENETSYIVNHLLRFALSQSGDFQKHKESLAAKLSDTGGSESGRIAAAAPVQLNGKDSR